LAYTNRIKALENEGYGYLSHETATTVKQLRFSLGEVNYYKDIIPYLGTPNFVCGW